ncbi:sensor histidine kinase [Vallitalea okinawensis]|uniref:sensor histidine kinase n=1 Tax=Vallitalea okinawensis TaxID=2078660 RepID=UPI00147823FC|nr:ATP-binding protein [Vallitalea okinawensis]
MKPLNRFIHIKILTFSILVLGVTVLLLNLSFQFIFKNYIDDSRDKDIDRVIAQIEKTVEDQVVTQEEFQLLNRLVNAYQMVVTVTLEEEVVYQSASMRKGMISAPPEGEDANQLLITKPRRALPLIPMDEENLVYKSYSIDSSDIMYQAKVGVLSNNISEIDRHFLVTMNVIFVFLFIAAIVATLFISKIISKKIVNPILSIKKQTANIYKKEYQQVSSINTDILELRELSKDVEELANELEIQENYQQQMTVDIAHELRSPLAVLRSHMEALIDKIWEPSPERLSRCYDEIIRLTTLVDDLNDLAMIERAGFYVELTKVDLKDIIKAICVNFESMYQEKDLYLKINLEDNLVMIGDSNRLKQIFINLLMNSLKYTDQGGVEIKAYKEKDDVVVEIMDTGIGMRKEQLDFIFKRFYRTDSSRSRKTGGAGIGLSIVKGLVEAHNGRIQVESQFDQGTIFKMSFSAIQENSKI